MNHFAKIAVTVALSSAALLSETILLTGTVRGSDSAPLSGVVVSLVSGTASDTTGVDGTYSLNGGATQTVAQSLSNAGVSFRVHGSQLTISGGSGTVSYAIYSLKGQEILSGKTAIAANSSSISMVGADNLASGVYCLSVSVNGQKFNRTFIAGSETGVQSEWASAKASVNSRSARAAVDTITFAKSGYTTLKQPVESFTGTIDAVLQKISGWAMKALPETGQTQSFTDQFGEDADYTINPLSYTDNGDGTVTDNVTGLMWQKAQSEAIGSAAAVTYADTLTLGGYSDWRLPTAHEAFSIQNQGTANPSTDTTVFTKSDAQYWWSGTVGKDKAGRVWLTNSGGGIGSHDTTESITVGGTTGVKKICVRAVRSENPINVPSFTVVSDSIVRDENTGLEWCRYSIGEMLWDTALVKAESAVIGGFDDWRLPNVKELNSINDETRFNPSLDTLMFPDAKSLIKTGAKPNQKVCEFWSSTTLVNHPENCWYVDYTTGLVSYHLRASAVQYVRLVRGGK